MMWLVQGGHVSLYGQRLRVEDVIGMAKHDPPVVYPGRFLIFHMAMRAGVPVQDRHPRGRRTGAAHPRKTAAGRRSGKPEPAGRYVGGRRHPCYRRLPAMPQKQTGR